MKRKKVVRTAPLIGHSCDVNTATIMSFYNIESVQKMVQIVEQWAKDHPFKTRQSEFLKMFPNAVIDEDDGILGINPCAIDESIGCTDGKGCDGCRRKYWKEEVSE